MNRTARLWDQTATVDGQLRRNTDDDCAIVVGVVEREFPNFKCVAMEGASCSKTALKRGAESRRSTNSAGSTHKRQRPNDEQSGNLGMTTAATFRLPYTTRDTRGS